MKRIFSLLILPILLCGCSVRSYQTERSTFYYPRSDVAYGSDEGVITPEVRTLSGSLAALLAVYLQGPESADLSSPCPEGTQLISTVWEDTTLILSLSEEFSELEGIDRTVACVCIARTCFSLSKASTVVIKSPASDGHAGVSVTYQPGDFLLYDEIAETEQGSAK